MNKYKVGDRVRIVDEWDGYRGRNIYGKMDKWLGKVMTIREVTTDHRGYAYRMDEDREEMFGEGWTWYEFLIAEKVGEAPIYPTCISCKYACGCCVSRRDKLKCAGCENHHEFEPAENIKHCPITGMSIIQNQYTRCKHMEDNGICSNSVMSNSIYCKYPCRHYQRMSNV